MASRRIMVCGGAGFVGSHLVDRLLAEGHEVDVVDDLSSGTLLNLADARNATGRFKFQNIDVLGGSFSELVAHRRPDVIVNLISLTPSQSTSAGILRSMSAAVVILEAAQASSVGKVISTVPAKALYGECLARDLPIKEGHINDPRSLSEIAARSIAEMHTVFRDSYAIEFTVLATANVYGPRQRVEDGVVAAFAESHLNGRAAIIHGSGKQTRDFVYIDDVVDAIARALDRAGGLVVNVGTGRAVAVSDLWSMIAGTGGGSPRTSSARAHDVARLALSPIRARIQLGWSPFTELETGLGHTISALAASRAAE